MRRITPPAGGSLIVGVLSPGGGSLIKLWREFYDHPSLLGAQGREAELQKH